MNLIPFLFLLLFALLHSLLAAEKFKSALLLRIPALNRTYRLLYNFIALALYLPALWLHLNEPGKMMVGQSFILMAVAVFLMAIGSWGLWKAFLAYDAGEFIGWRIPSGRPQLQISGWNAEVRHPLYSAMIVLLAGFLLQHLSVERLIFVGIHLIYLRAGIQLEEAKLLQLFGQEYANYRAKVPMLIPRLWKTKGER
jgi:protein-S-isoprenylcysteine O-methyltransferase Ste14